MDECIDLFGDAKIFSTLEAKSGYWKVEIAEEDQEKPPLHPIMVFPFYSHALQFEGRSRDFSTSYGCPVDESKVTVGRGLFG